MLCLSPLLAACGSDQVTVASFPVSSGQRAQCRQLLKALPHRVAGQQRRPVGGSPFATAWGDPPIVLRCGVARPRGFTKSSACQTARGIDWFIPTRVIEHPDAAVRMTAIHRTPYVQVMVPPSYRKNAGTKLVEVMADLAATLKAQLPKTGDCT